MLTDSFKKYNFSQFFNLEFIFYIVCWLLFWLSINSKPSQLMGTNLEILNGVRSIIPSILIVPLVFILIKSLINKDKFFKNINLEIIVTFLLFLYLVFQILGGLHLIGKKNYLEYNFLAFSFLSLIIATFLYFNNKFKKNIIIFTSLISLSFVCVLTIFYTVESIDAYFFDPNVIFLKWMYAIHPITNEILGSPYPRITGMSRIIAIFCVIIFILFLILKNIYYKLFIFITFNFFSTIIWFMQSRGALICFVSTIFFLILFQKKINFVSKFFLVFLLLLIPYSSAEFISNAKFNYNIVKFNEQCIKNKKIDLEKNKICNSEKNVFIKNTQLVKSILNKDERNEKKVKTEKKNDSIGDKTNLSELESSVNKDNAFRLLSPHNNPNIGYSSGRLNIWKKILELHDYSNFFGIGSQGDRQLLSNKESTFILSSNASNLFIYTFISSGYLGITAMIITCAIIFYTVLKLFIKDKKLYSKNNFHKLVGSSIIIFLFIRSLVENSFGIFSIDSLLFINSIMLIFSNFSFSFKNNI
tara:strand:+ start:636 stop:2222 length:1587 start_codon:yes stop_codon:yes gene_type:complete